MRTYIRELDALRALAILSVITHHWAPKDTLGYHLATAIDAPNIFFTISGFLVTKILLGDRAKAEAAGISPWVVYRNFFVKRALRIYPAYYLTILVMYLLYEDALTSAGYWSYLFFGANFDIYQNQEWGFLAHLWSMGVEQQFYLVWPLLMLFLPHRHLLTGILAFIGIGLVSQRLMPDNEFARILTPTVLDTLGIGALLAWIDDRRKPWLARMIRWGKWVALACGAGIYFQYAHNLPLPLSGRTLVALLTAWLIGFFLVKARSGRYALSTLFNNSVLLFLGKISYSLYLYHITVGLYTYPLLEPLNRHLPQALKESYLFFKLEDTLLLVVVAWISWRYLEQPIQGLKRYFALPCPQAESAASDPHPAVHEAYA